MMVEEFQQANIVDGPFHIGVKQRKIFYAYSPTILAVKPDEYSSLSLYVNKVGPLVNPQRKNIFLSGNSMDSVWPDQFACAPSLGEGWNFYRGTCKKALL